jgi:hypothetical protein
MRHPNEMMSKVTARERVLRTVEEMPPDVTFDDVTARIYLLQKIERGRVQIASGEGVPHAQARREMKRWHE